MRATDKCLTALILLPSALAHSATINVPADQPTIQAAIVAAVNGDEVVVAPGTYNEAINFNGKAITLRSSDGAAATTIDATGLDDSVVKCVSGETSTTVLDGFTITGGNANGASFPDFEGGGMLNIGSSPTVVNCIFDSNTARIGGGMANEGGSSPTVTHCQFISNTATQEGGGMTNYDGSNPTVSNCTFIANTAQSQEGGGMHNQLNCDPTVTNCTFSGNTAGTSGGGMFNHFDSSPLITNCIFWENSDAGGMDESGQIHTNTGTPTVNYSDIQGGWTGSGTSNINADPQFVNPGAGDWRLSSGSPCIETGDSSVVTEPTDLDGNPRIAGVAVDMGAYENLCGSLVHNVTQNTFFSSIQTAIDAAAPNDIIEAGPCTYHELIDLKGKAITVRSTNPIDPAVVMATVIDAGPLADPGTGKPVVRCQNGEGADTVLNGFTITGGTGDSTLIPGRVVGGGMFNNASSPTVLNCKFAFNRMLDFPSDSHGAGMYNHSGSSPTVTNCIFEGNETGMSFVTGDGGGMFNSLSSNAEVTNCTFVNNAAHNGGGIFNVDSNPTIQSCTFTDNLAYGNGGGLTNLNSHPLVSDCDFFNNQVDGGGGGGGGMYNENSHPTLVNCDFDSNEVYDGCGGGMHNNSSSPDVTQCTFVRNDCWYQGGGMYNRNGSNPVVSLTNFHDNGPGPSRGGGMANANSSPVISQCNFSENYSGDGPGGGIHNSGTGHPVIRDCTFSLNRAESVAHGGGITTRSTSCTIVGCLFIGNYGPPDGGGLAAWNDVTVKNCTFVQNTAHFNGGGIVGTANVINSIVWNNIPDQIGPNWDGGNATVNYSNIQGGWPGLGSNNIDADPLFVDAANDDFHLMSGSPCIDAGDNASVPIGVTTDLDGFPRIIRCVDMGAYEHPIPAGPPADRDCDGDVDGVDFAVFASCFNGAGNPPRSDGCEYESPTGFDFDDDGDVDGVDFSTFASCFNKAGNPPRTFGCPQN